MTIDIIVIIIHCNMYSSCCNPTSHYLLYFSSKIWLWMFLTQHHKHVHRTVSLPHHQSSGCTQCSIINIVKFTRFDHDLIYLNVWHIEKRNILITFRSHSQCIIKTKYNPQKSYNAQPYNNSNAPRPNPPPVQSGANTSYHPNYNNSNNIENDINNDKGLFTITKIK